MATATATKEQARTRDMEQQIAYLRWKKMQNDREIKKAIVVSRALKKKDEVLSLSQDTHLERFGWAHAVVKDELERPLVISDAELFYLESEEVRCKNRLTKYSQRHLRIIENTLKDLSKKEFHHEVARQTNEEKIQILNGLKREVKEHIRDVTQAAPIIYTHSAVPRLYN